MAGRGSVARISWRREVGVWSDSDWQLLGPHISTLLQEVKNTHCLFTHVCMCHNLKWTRYVTFKKYIYIAMQKVQYEGKEIMTYLYISVYVPLKTQAKHLPPPPFPCTHNTAFPPVSVSDWLRVFIHCNVAVLMHTFNSALSSSRTTQLIVCFPLYI